MTTTPTPQEQRQQMFDFVRAGRRSGQLTETGAAGGYLVPAEFRSTIVEALDTFSPVRRLADHLTTKSSASFPVPTVDDTSGEGDMIGEGVVLTDDDLTFGGATVAAWPFTSKLLKVSLALVQDAGLPIVDRLGRILGRRIARGQNRKFTVGTGMRQPHGLVPAASVGVTTAAAAVITFDELVGLKHSVDAAYREDLVGCGWMMNDSTLEYVEKIRDDSGGSGLGAPVFNTTTRTLLDHPVFVNNHMADIGASARPILFGHYNAAYLVRDVQDTAVQRLDERFADSLEIGLVAWHRSDGTVQDASAYAALEMHA